LSAVVAYARVIDLGGQSGRFEGIAPYLWLNGSASYIGQSVERIVNGLADPIVRLSANFYGAPALTLKEFSAYEQDLIVGGSLQVVARGGQYDDTRVVNIGMHRWSFKPEIGGSAAHWRFPLTSTTRSSSMPAVGCRIAPGTAST
jgi:hypothetical protein